VPGSWQRTRACAVAERTLSSLPPTSTIHTLPSGATWLSSDIGFDSSSACQANVLRRGMLASKSGMSHQTASMPPRSGAEPLCADDHRNGSLPSHQNNSTSYPDECVRRCKSGQARGPAASPPPHPLGSSTCRVRSPGCRASRPRCPERLQPALADTSAIWRRPRRTGASRHGPLHQNGAAIRV
jgi:hypothetical protein